VTVVDQDISVWHGRLARESWAGRPCHAGLTGLFEHYNDVTAGVRSFL